MNKHFIFHASYYECVQRFPPETQKNIIYNLVRYAITRVEPTNTTPEEELAFVLMKPALDKSIRNMTNGSKNGIKNTKNESYIDFGSEIQSEVRSETQSKSESESEKSLPGSLLYQNNIKETDKQTLFVKENKNKLSVRTCTRDDIVENFKRHYQDFFDCHEKSEFGAIGNEVLSIMADYAITAEKKPIKYNGKLYSAEDVVQLIIAISVDQFMKIISTIKFSSDIKDKKRYIFGCFLHQQHQIKK